MKMRIVEGGLDDARVVALLEHHIAMGRANTVEGCAHALDVSGLQRPGIRFWTAWRDDMLLGTGALKRIDDGHAEVKSMHVAQAARRQGVGGAMLDHILREARAMGFKRVSLETGSWDYFAPARAMYATRGFIECAPFEGYKPDPASTFMSREI
jgi:putative acetyltransferase